MTEKTPRAARQAILIVEDEPIIRMVARDVLEEADFEVIEADSAAAAVAILEARTDIHAVFTDVHMPGGIDGLSLARTVSERWPEVRIAVTSGRARPEEAELPKGTLFVPKPYRTEQLVAMLQRLVSGGNAS